MSREGYQAVLLQAHAVFALARAIDPDELDRAIRANDLAESVGPILDATLWQRKGHAAREDREVLIAVRHLAAVGHPAERATERRIA